MLKALKKIALHHRQAADLGLTTLLKTPVASLLTLLVISIALLFPALLWLSTHSLQAATQEIKEQGRFSIYLKPKTHVNAQNKALQKIKNNTLVGEAILISPEQGLALLKRQEGMQDILTYMGHNPLPPVIEVTPLPTVASPAELDRLYQELKAIPDVESVKIDKQWVSRFHAILSVLSQLADGLFILLGGGVFLIIGNTLRMMIEHRREEIEVLKLIGASHRYIMRPFLYVGAIYAGLAAILAILLLQLIMVGLALLLNQVASLYDMHVPIIGFTFIQSLIFIGGAGILGWLAARLSVKSQLAFIEP